jgi:hypothetical protein
MMRACLETITSVPEKKKQMEEIDACSRAFLQSYCQAWSVQGLWHRVLRQIILRRTATIHRRMMDSLSATQGLAEPASTVINRSRIASTERIAINPSV